MRRTSSAQPPATVAGEYAGDTDEAGKALSGWESEGGGRGTLIRQNESAAAMLRGRGRAATSGLATATQRRMRRARIRLEIRRLEAQIKSNIDALGHEVFPLLEAGRLDIEAAAVRVRMVAITSLQAELQQKQAAVAALSQSGDAEHAKQVSIANVDSNATPAATQAQSASDATASASDQPADEGGQG